MSKFRFYYPIQIRYSDLDPQWHVNNTSFLKYLEQTRLAYLIELGLFDGVSFFDINLILADTHIAYLKPITLATKIRVGMRVVHIGTKSMRLEYRIEEKETGKVFARAETIHVAYDYRTKKSMPVPATWREKIAAYEGISSGLDD